MSKFLIPLQITVEAVNEADAIAQQAKVEKALSNRYVKTFLDSSGVKVLGYALGKPVLAPGQAPVPPKKP